ncbi:MAG: DUF4286 family protein [Cytophagaceae bacterium]
MILYSITINIDNTIHKEWLEWMIKNYLPQQKATGLFLETKILRLLNEVHNEGVTYSFQYYLQSHKELDYYLEVHEDAIYSQLLEKYNNRFVEFRTTLEVVG